MARVVIFLALLAFTVYTLVDCVQSRDDRVRNLPKIAWAALILFFPVVGGLAWFIAGRPVPVIPPYDQRRPRPPIPRGPDDDPDFLRGL